MKIISSIQEMQTWANHIRVTQPAQKIALIPTMGCLHQGHLSLIKNAATQAEHTVVSIFVNPLQFNQEEDFEKYPKNVNEDIALLTNEKVDILFIPKTEEVFSIEKPRIQISIPSLTSTMCGAYRPGHFEGVLFIVHNLFMWVKPHLAFFGKKDYQQCCVIKTMVTELCLNVNIILGETIRENNGLAMSSRNTRLSKQGKEQGLVLYHTIKDLQSMADRHMSLISMRNVIQRNLHGLQIDYADLYHPTNLTLLPDESKSKEALLAMAIWIEGVRLIDNEILSLKYN